MPGPLADRPLLISAGLEQRHESAHWQLMTALLEKEDMQISKFPTVKGPKGMNQGWSSSHLFGDQLSGCFLGGVINVFCPAGIIH